MESSQAGEPDAEAEIVEPPRDHAAAQARAFAKLKG